MSEAPRLQNLASSRTLLAHFAGFRGNLNETNEIFNRMAVR